MDEIREKAIRTIIDTSIKSGKEIPIEERNHEEGCCA